MLLTLLYTKLLKNRWLMFRLTMPDTDLTWYKWQSVVPLMLVICTMHFEQFERTDNWIKYDDLSYLSQRAHYLWHFCQLSRSVYALVSTMEKRNTRRECRIAATKCVRKFISQSNLSPYSSHFASPSALQHFSWRQLHTDALIIDRRSSESGSSN